MAVSVAFRFLHAADLHLDTPFTGLGATSPPVATLLRDASLLAFDELVRCAIAREVDAVVLAGDVYDGPARGVRAQLRLLRGTQRLADAGIATFIAHGNHDPVDDGWTAVRAWPDLVTVFPPGEVLSVPVVRDGMHLATVHGTSYARRHETENLALRFDVGDAPGPHVAVLHANVGGQPGHDPYSPCSVDDLVRLGIDYWALGHVHTRQVLHREPWVVYPGNLQGRHGRETGPHGGLIVDIDDSGRITEPEFVAFDRVRLEDIEVDVTPLADLGALADHLRATGHAQLAAADGRSVLARVQLVGRGRLHDDVGRPGVLSDLLADLRDDEVDHPPLLWWDRIVSATRGPRDMDAISERNDFVADMIDEAHELRTERGPEVRAGWDADLPADVSVLLDPVARSDHCPRALERAFDLVDRHEG
jgi:exonuclease SbcD